MSAMQHSVRQWVVVLLCAMGVVACGGKSATVPAASNRAVYPIGVSGQKQAPTTQAEFQAWIARAQTGGAFSPQELNLWQQKALSGDILAQRGIALAYLASQNGKVNNPVLACAWMFVVTRSNAARVDPVDAKFMDLACNQSLNGTLRAQALQTGTGYYRQIYNKNPYF